MTDKCEWLHEHLERLPLVQYPFVLTNLPNNGIYVFYEMSEMWGHGGDKPRIVRIGTHKPGNLRSRINEHYLLDERKMRFDASNPAPKDRSIFRKNIGRALLAQANDPYLDVWNIDFTSRQSRQQNGHLRAIEKEKQIETEITRILRSTFSFRYIAMDLLEKRMGTQGLEAAMIGTVAQCSECQPSLMWLGLSSPVARIRSSGLWQSQHVDAAGIRKRDQEAIVNAIADNGTADR